MVILVSEDSNRYAHLFLIEREYFGFNTLECCWINMKYLAYLNIMFGDNHVQNSGNCKKGGPEDHLGIKNRIKKIPVN